MSLPSLPLHSDAGRRSRRGKPEDLPSALAKKRSGTRSPLQMKGKAIFILTFVIAMISHGQDTLLIRSLDKPVIVLGQSLIQSNLSSLSRYYNEADLGKMLSATGQAYVNSYGAPGAASLVRNAGMSPDHSVISWNGVPLNSPTLGMSDCTLIPTLFMDRIHAGNDRGEGFKPSALSSVISLSPEIQDDGLIELTGNYSSLNNVWNGIRTDFSRGKLSTSVRAFINQNRNRFDYRDVYVLGNPLVTQEHNDNESWGTMVSSKYQFNRQYSVSLDWWNADKSTHLPARMGHIAQRNESQEDAQQRLMIRFNKKSKNPDGWNAGIQSAVIADDQNFVSAGLHPSDMIQSHTTAKRFLNGVTLNRQFGRLTWNAGIMHQVWDIGYDRTREVREPFLSAFTEFRTVRERGVTSVWTSWETRENKLYPDFMLRHGWSHIHQRVISGLTLEGGIISRVPDMNERYWNPGGNPALLPELNRTSRVTLSLTSTGHKRTEWEVSVSPFVNVVTNWIQWVPDHENVWSAVNFSQVRSAGAESRAALALTLERSSLRLNFNWIYTSAKGSHGTTWTNDQVFRMIYAPENRAFISMEWIGRYFSFGGSGHYTDSRFTEESNTARYSLPAYTLIDVFAATEISAKGNHRFSIRARCENLLNTRYESVRLYAMPGRVFSLSLVYTLSKP